MKPYLGNFIPKITMDRNNLWFIFDWFLVHLAENTTLSNICGKDKYLSLFKMSEIYLDCWHTTCTHLVTGHPLPPLFLVLEHTASYIKYYRKKFISIDISGDTFYSWRCHLSLPLLQNTLYPGTRGTYNYHSLHASTAAWLVGRNTPHLGNGFCICEPPRDTLVASALYWRKRKHLLKSKNFLKYIQIFEFSRYVPKCLILMPVWPGVEKLWL